MPGILLLANQFVKRLRHMRLRHMRSTAHRQGIPHPAWLPRRSAPGVKCKHFVNDYYERRALDTFLGQQQECTVSSRRVIRRKIKSGARAIKTAARYFLGSCKIDKPVLHVSSREFRAQPISHV
jgi:hypothetical protein